MPRPFSMKQLEFFTPQFLPLFNKHQKWVPVTRFIKLGYDMICNDKAFFSSKVNAFKYGLSQPQFKAINYWLLAFKIADEYQGCLYPTDFGKKLFEYDSYLENPASAILLHYNLLKPPSLAPSWFILFNYYNQIGFNNKYIVEFIKDKSQTKVAVFSIVTDIKCIQLMYQQESNKFDEYGTIFNQLNLVNYSEDKGIFNLNNHIFKQNQYAVAYTFIDWMIINQKFKLSDACYSEASPGMAFKLSRTYAEEILDIECEGYHLTIDKEFQPRINISKTRVLDELMKSAFQK